ncbi:aldehyde dehydrogenase (NAD+) [Malassezia pachydermatis]
MEPLMKMTPTERIPAIVDGLRAAFLTGKTRSLEYRKKQLKQLYFLVDDNKELFIDSIHKDLGRHSMETTFGEIISIKNEIITAINHLNKWAKDKTVWAGVPFAMHSTYVRKDPKGTVLVLGAWNYPITVQLGPMVGAIAAGNTVLLKPSELSEHTAQLIADLWPKYMDAETSAVVNGGIPQATALLDQRFEHIFYTGNGRVGSIVAEKAAKHLCPVSLELGGKSPVIIDESADISVAAHRLLWAKAFNTGQTCIAPDYVLVHRKVQDKLVAALTKARQEFWKSMSTENKDFGRIVSTNHWKRLRDMVSNSKAEMVAGDLKEADEATRFMPLTIFNNVTADDSTMADEIFGPILPIMPVDSVRQAIDFVNSRDQPLALYVFARDQPTFDYIMKYTRSGGVVRGDMLLHYVIEALPFGGTGPAGYGAYHGKTGFDCFTHERAVVEAPANGLLGRLVESVMSQRYPPYTAAKLRFFKMTLASVAWFGRPKNPTQSDSSIDRPVRKVSRWLWF